MKIFNQQDYNQTIGDTKFTIARWGCLLTVCTMIYDFIFKKSLNPFEISKKLSFDANGNLIWSSLENIGLKLVSRVRFYDKVGIDKAYKSDDNYIALQVNGNHWVWVVGRYVPYFGYRIADPLRGDITYTNRYGNKITGHAIITAIKEEKPVCTKCCPVHCK